MGNVRYTQAVRTALIEEMERDTRIIVLGEDVELSMFGDTRGLIDRFGPDRIRNTPICEAALTGIAVGAAAAGYRVVLHMMFSNFIYTGFDAIANQMARLRLMSGGQIALPITVMALYGGGSSQAAQHSDCPHPALMGLGGIEVLLPAIPADAKGMMKAAIRSDNPTFFLVGVGLGATSGDVPEGDYVSPIGKVGVLNEGSDITILTIGSMIKAVRQATKTLQAEGHSVHVVDVRCVAPLDEDGILAAAARTGRILIADEARERGSAASEISALIADRGFSSLKAPIRRATAPNVSMPYAPNAEAAVFPNSAMILSAARDLLAHQ